MFYGPVFNEGLDDLLFKELIDPVLPGRGLPLPARVALLAIELQVEAGQTIASGRVAGKYQYTGQAAQEERTQSLGMNLIYQPGGILV